MTCRRKILVVDDEPDAVEFLHDFLEDNGFKVFCASAAEEGLKIAEAEQLDLICLDVLMPEESGFSLYQKLRTDPKYSQVPVLIISGLSLSKELGQIHYLELPDGSVLPEPDGVLEKPVEIGRLMAFIERVMR